MIIIRNLISIMLPPDLALIDEARMLAITERMYPDGKVHVHRI